MYSHTAAIAAAAVAAAAPGMCAQQCLPQPLQHMACMLLCPLPSLPHHPASSQQSHHIVAILLELRIHLQGRLHITLSHRLPRINDLQTQQYSTAR